MVYKLNEKKEIRIPDEDIKRLVKTMNIDEEEAIEIWLEDEGYLINEEQEELCKLAKDMFVYFKVIPHSRKCNSHMLKHFLEISPQYTLKYINISFTSYKILQI